MAKTLIEKTGGVPQPTLTAVTIYKPDWGICFLLAVSGALLVAKLWFAGSAMLLDDEAYYTLWSKHLALGYVDHPPLIAAFIKLSTLVFGYTEFGVRALSLIAWTVLGYIAYLFGNRLRNARMGLLLAAATQLTPFLAGVSAIITPDSTLILFAFLALFAWHQAFFVNEKWFPAGGFALGLAILSKLSGVLFGLGIAAFLFLTPAGRRHLRSPYLWTGIGITIALASIYLVWNFQNDFISIKWLYGGLLNKETNIAEVTGLWTAQLALQTPLVVIGGITLLWRAFRRRKSFDESKLFFACASAIPLLVIFAKSIANKLEGNWPAIGFVGLLALVVLDISDRWHERRLRIATLVNFGVFGVTCVLVAVQAVYPVLDFGGIDSTKRLHRFDAFRGELRDFARRNPNALFFGLTYQIPSMFNFYARPAIEATCLSFGEYHPTAYLSWTKEYPGADYYFITDRPVQKEVRARFASVQWVRNFVSTRRGKQIARFQMYLCKNYRPIPAEPAIQ